MGFWIFMLIMDLLVPLTMLGFGWLFRHRAPGDINFLFGYRTEMSMKNKETWEFAHRHCGQLWQRISIIMLPLSAVPLLFVIDKGEDPIGYVGAGVCLLQIAVLIGSIFPTEAALKKEFDENGNRREK